MGDKSNYKHYENVSIKLQMETLTFESESIAYTVSAALSNMGIEIDTSDYSFGYIAGWSSDKDLRELKESLEVIRIVSDKIISGIEDYFEIREYQKDIAIEMADELADEHMRKEIKEADMDAKEVKCEATKNSIVAANIVGAAVVVGADVVADIDKKQETFKDRLCDAKRIIEHTNEIIVDKKVKGIKSKGLEV